MNRSFLAAGVITLAAVAWVASGSLGGDATQEPQKPAAIVAAADAETPVRVQTLTPTARERQIVLRGVTEARRVVEIQAETTGRILTFPVTEGTPVAAGDLLVQLDVNERQARVQEAEALVTQREIEYAAAAKLAKNGYRAETDVAAAAAALKGAQAMLEAATIELSHTQIVAPFAGIVERQLLDEGAYADHGTPLLRLVQLDPLIVTAFANEQEVLSLSQGAPGQALLPDGTLIDGTLTFVARSGEVGTRSFRVELELANPASALPAGITADILVKTPAQPAYKVSPAVLVLDEKGRLGVRAVDQDNRVIFYPATILDDEADGIWLGGLPEKITLIVVGQEFVKTGQKVKPLVAGAPS